MGVCLVLTLNVLRQQRTSACEVEFTKEMCEGVLKTLQSTWDLTPSDLKRVANVIKVEEEVRFSLVLLLLFLGESVVIV